MKYITRAAHELSMYLGKLQREDGLFNHAECARRAYIALCDRLDENANLTGVCVGTNRKNSREWYMNRPRIVGDPHGQAPMLWICGALLRD
jgi:hypothetical protein